MKTHGNTSKANAKKDVTKSVYIQMRVLPKLKAAFVKQMLRDKKVGLNKGDNLTEWLCRLGKAALDDDIKQ